MRKAIAILCVVLSLLALCACETKVTENNILGTWSAEFENVENGSDNYGDIYRITIALYKGGTGNLDYYNITDDKQGGNYSCTWSFSDGVANVSASWMGMTVNIGMDFVDEVHANSVDGIYAFVKQ